MSLTFEKTTQSKINNSLSKLDKHDEFEVMFMNYSKEKKVNLSEFINIVKVLTNYCRQHKLAIENNNSLDINFSYDINSFSIYRLSINEQSLIEEMIGKYGNRKNHVIFSALVAEMKNNKDKIKLLNKKRNNKLTFDVPKYDLRFRVASETSPNRSEVAKLKKLSESERFNISFRLKQRASFILHKYKNYTLQADCTISKISL